MKKSFAIALFLSASVNAYAIDGGILGTAVCGATSTAIGSQTSEAASAQNVSTCNGKNDDIITKANFLFAAWDVA